MAWIQLFVDYILHMDKHLGAIIQYFGSWTHLLFFIIIFCETGLVVTPVLPGDSLLFAIGTFAARDYFNPHVMFLILALAAILGDTANYWIGYFIGPKVFQRENVRFLNKKHLEKTHRFYERHGGKTIILARFIPIIRTFAPFVAGIGVMNYWKFLAYNFLGGLAWVGLFVYGGYYFGNLPMIKRNFTLVILAIVFLSILPPILEIARQKFRAQPES